MWTMTLNDGTKISGLKMKGACMSSTKELTAEMFAGKLCPVTITGKLEADEDEFDYTGLEGRHEHMRLMFIRKEGDEWRAGLGDIPAGEWELAKLAGDVGYVAMMNGIDLEG